MSASHHISTLTPLHQLARSILNKYYEVIFVPESSIIYFKPESFLLQIHDAFKEIFAKKKDKRELYEHIWESVPSKLFALEAITHDEIENAFNQIEDYISKHAPADELLINIVHFYKCFAQLSYQLHQIATLGTAIDSVDNQNEALKRDADARLREVDAEPTTKLVMLAKAKQSIGYHKKELIDHNNLVSNLDSLLYEESRNFKKTLEKDYDNFYKQISVHQTARSDLSKQLTIFNEKLLHQQDIQTMIESIAATISSLESKMKMVKAVNDGLLQQEYDSITAIEKTIVDFKKQSQKKENLLAEELEEYTKQIAELDDDLYVMQTHPNGTANTLLAYIKNLENLNLAEKLPNIFFDLTKLPSIKEADALCIGASVGANHLNKAIGAMNHAELNTNKLRELLFKSNALHLQKILTDVRDQTSLTNANSNFKNACKKLAKLVRADYYASVFFKTNLLSLARTIDTAATLADKEIDTTQRLVTGHEAQLIFELELFDKFLKTKIGDYHSRRSQYLKKKGIFDEDIIAYNDLRTSIITAIKQKLERMRTDNLSLFEGHQKAALTALQYMYTNDFAGYKHEKFQLPKTPIQIYNRDTLASLEKRLQKIKNRHQNHFAAVRKAHDRVYEEIFPSKNPIPFVPPEPNFFMRHWRKITAAVTLGVILGGGVGFALGTFTTIGLASLPLLAIGAAVGACVGFFSGVTGGLINDKFTKNQLPSSAIVDTTKTVHQRLGTAVDISPSSQSAPAPEKRDENVVVVSDKNQYDDSLTFHPSDGSQHHLTALYRN